MGVAVHDALRVTRGGQIKYLIMHGHQFDSVCLQAGAIPYAKSLGEIYTECTSWAFQGAEACGRSMTPRSGSYGNSISNILAREKPGTYQGGTSGQWDLLWDDVDRIKEQPKDFIETLLGHEVGWEYLENTNGYDAFTLEVWTGDEAYKLRSLNEVDLCLGYTNAFYALRTPPDFTIPIPKLVVGHTHEPRQNAVFPVESGGARAVGEAGQPLRRVLPEFGISGTSRESHLVRGDARVTSTDRVVVANRWTVDENRMAERRGQAGARCVISRRHSESSSVSSHKWGPPFSHDRRHVYMSATGHYPRRPGIRS